MDAGNGCKYFHTGIYIPFYWFGNSVFLYAVRIPLFPWNREFFPNKGKEYSQNPFIIDSVFIMEHLGDHILGMSVICSCIAWSNSQKFWDRLVFYLDFEKNNNRTYKWSVLVYPYFNHILCFVACVPACLSLQNIFPDVIWFTDEVLDFYWLQSFFNRRIGLFLFRWYDRL